MLDLLFNGFLFFMVAVWLIGMVKRKSLAGLTGSLKKHGRVFVPIVVWAVFLVLAASYLVWFDQFSAAHDIPEAVDAGVIDVSHGGNPYVDKVIPRFDTPYGVDTKIDNGTYNYLPVDLMVYAGMHRALGFLGSPLWFVVSNLMLWSVAFAAFYGFVHIKLRGYIPFAGTCMLFYSFDNAALTALLMVASIYALKKLRSDRAGIVSIIIMGLAVLTKAYAVVPFMVLFLWLLEEQLRPRRVKESVRLAMAGVASAAIGVLVMVPFGISNVLNSAVFFHMSTVARAGTSVGGTALAELAMGSPYFAFIAVGAIVAALLVSLKLRNLYDRIVLVSIVFSFVSIKSSLALLIVPGFFIVLRVREWMEIKEPPPTEIGVSTISIDSAISSSK
jgi:hypothetical protein